MTKQQVKVELWYDGGWHDLVASDDVYTDPPIVITHGGGEEGAVVKPNRVTVRIANDDDRYRPSNPLSPLYGKVGLNTPCRVSVGSTVRVVGEASFEPDQTDDFRQDPPRGQRWVDVDAAGLSQRIAQWTEPEKSAFTAYNEDIAGLAGYWPMEDARGATIARSAIDGTFNVRLTGQSFGSQNAPPGGGPAIDVAANSLAGFVFVPGDPQSAAGWEYSVVTYLGDLSSSGTGYPTVALVLLNGTQIIFDVIGNPIGGGGAQVSLLIINGATTLFTGTFTTNSYNFGGRWIMWHCRCTVAAGTVTVGVSWRGVDDTGFVGVSGTFAGTATSQIYGADLSSMPEGSSYGHVIGGPGVLDLDSDDRFDAFLGHPGELAASRFARLCFAKGIGCFVSDGWEASRPMGPQRIDTFPGQLREIQQTDDALIYDHGTESVLYMLCGADRVNQAATLVLDASNTVHLQSPPKEVINDLNPHNVVTASQNQGGDFTLRDDSSPMGTLPPPNGVGEYRQTVDVNVGDEVTDLPQVAGWWLAKGTNGRPRFPTITVDLVAAPGLIAAVEATDTGNVIELVNYREFPIRLYVLGWQEKLGTHTRTVTFTCALNDVYDAGVIGTARLDASSTTLNAAVTASATTLVLKMTDRNEQWRPGSNAVPVVIGGELITLGTVGAVTGSGPWTQTVTGCTRAVNGISKAQPAGAPVRVYGAIRPALWTI